MSEVWLVLIHAAKSAGVHEGLINFVSCSAGQLWSRQGLTRCWFMQDWLLSVHAGLVFFTSHSAGRFWFMQSWSVWSMLGWSAWDHAGLVPLAHTELVSLVRKGLVGFCSMENWSILVRAGLVCLGSCRTYRGWSTQGIRFRFRLGCSVLAGLVDFSAYMVGHCPGRAGRLLSFQVWSAFVPKDQLGKAVQYYFKFPSEKVKNEM